jgi:ParB family chromosome partitioning protein
MMEGRTMGADTDNLAGHNSPASTEGSQTVRPEVRRRALGRGIETLLRPVSRTAEEPIAPGETGKAFEIPLDRIDRNPFQTRTTFDPEKLSELAQSIAATGVVQPIVVRPLPNGRYQLIMGERRWLASQQAGKTAIPATVREASDEQAMEMTIVENLQRADLNPMEQARAYHRLQHDFKMTQEQMAVRTGKERASVANFLRLLRLPEAIQQKVEAGELSFGHARALLGLEDADQISSAAQKVLALSLSVRQTESFVQGLLHPETKGAKPAKADTPQDPNVHEAQERLQRSLGLKVRIEDRHGKGRVIIDYGSLEDFDALLSALEGEAR